MNGCHSNCIETCVNLHTNLISTKLSTSQCKCMQGLAKLSRKKTQVFNLQLLARPFDPVVLNWQDHMTHYQGVLARMNSCHLLRLYFTEGWSNTNKAMHKM